MQQILTYLSFSFVKWTSFYLHEVMLWSLSEIRHTQVLAYFKNSWNDSYFITAKYLCPINNRLSGMPHLLAHPRNEPNCEGAKIICLPSKFGGSSTTNPITFASWTLIQERGLKYLHKWTKEERSSSSKYDRDREVIIPFLVNLKRYNKLPSFRVGHNSNCHPQFMSKMLFLFPNKQAKKIFKSIIMTFFTLFIELIWG